MLTVQEQLFDREDSSGQASKHTASESGKNSNSFHGGFCVVSDTRLPH